MYEELRGKKLLVLGCSQDECQIVRAAQSMGIYVITTDNHENWDDAPAKKISKKDKKKEKTKKKTSYSRFSGALTMSAINKKGTFKIKKRALTSKRLEIRMDSQKYNADLLLSQHDTFYGDEKQYEDPIVIRQWSKDGKSWKKLEMLTPMQEASGKKPAEGFPVRCQSSLASSSWKRS